MSPKKPLIEDVEHATATFKRWEQKIHRHRDPTLPTYEDIWITEQCLQCQFYVKLTGLLGLDWGVCSNSISPLDGRVMFEHDGCEYFSSLEEK